MGFLSNKYQLAVNWNRWLSTKIEQKLQAALADPVQLKRFAVNRLNTVAFIKEQSYDLLEKLNQFRALSFNSQRFYFNKMQSYKKERGFKANLSAVVATYSNRPQLLIKYIFGAMQEMEEAGEWGDLIQYGEKLPPEQYGEELRTFNMASLGNAIDFNGLEYWYYVMAKAHYELGQYTKSYEEAKKGLEIAPQNVWLKRQYSLACAKTRNLDEAITLHMQLTAELDRWFVFHELAKFYMLKMDFEMAHRVIAIAFSPRYSLRHFSYQWRLYYHAGLLLLGLANHSQSRLHLTIAKQQYWCRNKDIRDIINHYFDILINNQPANGISLSTFLSDQLKNRLNRRPISYLLIVFLELTVVQRTGIL